MAKSNYRKKKGADDLNKQSSAWVVLTLTEPGERNVRCLNT